MAVRGERYSRGHQEGDLAWFQGAESNAAKPQRQTRRARGNEWKRIQSKVIGSSRLHLDHALTNPDRSPRRTYPSQVDAGLAFTLAVKLVLVKGLRGLDARHALARSQEPAASSRLEFIGFTSPVADAMDWQRQETGNQPRHRALPRPRQRLRRPPGARTSGCAWCRDAPGAAWPVRIHTLWRACLAPRARLLTCRVCEMPHCGIACLIRFIQRARRAYGVHTACC